MRKKRKDCKTNKVRPRKAAGAKRRRQLEHRKRLIGLGVEESVVATMNSREIRDMLKYPAKVTKSLAAST